MDPMRFWEGLQQVKLSQKLPHLEEDVLSLDRTGNWSTFFSATSVALGRCQKQPRCVGFPIGGDTISVTSGVISRIEALSVQCGECGGCSLVYTVCTSNESNIESHFRSILRMW